jgi:RHS repeat-associated protein
LVATKTDGRGVVATNTYDALGRVIGITYSDATPSVTIAFNSDGWKTSMADGSGSTTYAYDNAGELTTRTAPQGAVTYAYDNANRLVTRASTGSTVAYAYNSEGLMTSTVVNGTQTTSNTYDNAGRMLTTTMPDGSVETKTYNATTADLTSVIAVKTGTTVTSSTYAYDNLGRKTSETTPTYVVSYGYDSAGQLTSEVRTGGNPYNIAYSYDLAGNRSSKTLAGMTEAYTYDNANKLLTAGSKSYTYDLAGNTTGVTGGGTNSTLAWDAEGRLKNATVGTNTTTYSYNGIGQRVAKGGATVNAYVLADDSIDSKVLSDGNATYAHGASGIVSESRAGTSKFYHADALGSTRALTNSAGSVTDSRSTDALGMVVTTSGTGIGAGASPFGFAGGWSYQQDSETGLMRLGYRMYDASMGRFLSRDPILAGRNWYAYCKNDSVQKVDPKGLQMIPWWLELIEGGLKLGEEQAKYEGPPFEVVRSGTRMTPEPTLEPIGGGPSPTPSPTVPYPWESGYVAPEIPKLELVDGGPGTGITPPPPPPLIYPGGGGPPPLLPSVGPGSVEPPGSLTGPVWSMPIHDVCHGPACA